MARSKEYRIRPEHAEEMRDLRRRLGLLTGSEWQQANCIMQRIAWLSGNANGPSRGLVMPRCCSECQHFGHTQQHCPVRREREQRAVDEEIERERDRTTRLAGEGRLRAAYQVQANYMDEIGMPYAWCPVLGGVGQCMEEGAVHLGKWTVRDGRVVANDEGEWVVRGGRAESRDGSKAAWGLGWRTKMASVVKASDTQVPWLFILTVSAPPAVERAMAPICSTHILAVKSSHVAAQRPASCFMRQVAAQQADAKDDGDMLAVCRESIENLRKEKAEMKIELNAAKVQHGELLAFHRRNVQVLENLANWQGDPAVMEQIHGLIGLNKPDRARIPPGHAMRRPSKQ
jgi:hypothetical protein